MPFAGVGIFSEGKNLPVSTAFVKCGRLKRTGVHKGIFAAALSGFCLCCLQQLASDSLAPELFADEKLLDAEPIAKCLSGQSGELLARLIFQEYADRDALGFLAVTAIVFLQHLVDLMDIALVSVVGYSKVHVYLLLIPICLPRKVWQRFVCLKTLLRLTFVVDTGKSRLLAQVFGLEFIQLASFDEVRSALAELEIGLLSDALFPDVKHPVIVERPCVPV